MKKNTWSEFKYELHNKLISTSHINNAVNNFNTKILNQLSEDQYLLVIFKIKTDDNLIRSISTLQRINKSSKLQEVFNEYWNLKVDNYNQMEVKEIIFNFFLRENKQQVPKPIITSPKNTNIRPNLLQIGGFNFPQTMDLYEWGTVDFILNGKEAIVYKKYSNAQYHVNFYKNTMTVKYILNSKTLISFTDELLDKNNLGTFKRTIKNQTIYFIDGKLSYKEKQYKYPSIKKLSPKPFLNNNFIPPSKEGLGGGLRNL